MNPRIEKLLAPVSEAQPCGPDYSYDPKFDELETILKGKPEVEIGSVQKPAEPPEWGLLREKSAEFLAESKHLRVAAMYACSLLRTEGVTGFRDGLQLIKAWVEQYWTPLHPVLDPDDNNDPTQRLNILGTLTAPRGSVTGWLTIGDYLYGAEICRSKGMPPITFDQLLTAKALPDPSEANRLTSAIRGTDNQVLLARQQALQESLEAVQALDQFLTTTLGSGSTISFEALEKTLRAFSAALQSILPGGGESASQSTAAATEASAAGSADSAGGNLGTAITVQGSVRSRDDVVRVIDSLCEYYAQVEPGSPVPYLLRRAQKMVKMDFMQMVHELNIATVETLRPSMGSVIEPPAPPA